MQERKDFKEAHVHKKAGMDFTIILSCLPVSSNESASSEGDLVLLVEKNRTDAFESLDGITHVALFDVEGVIIGDERRYETARFVRVTDDETLESIIETARQSEDVHVLVLRSFIDNLIDTVTTAAKN
jgi:ClpP class serine protease